MSWRIEPLDTERPVRIIIGGIGYCLTITDAMSLLRTAPKMAGKWEHGARDYDGAPTSKRRDSFGHVVAAVVVGSERWWACAPDFDMTDMTIDDDGRALCDAALRAAGWLLEEG